jgi:hypothetical protein
MATVFPPWPPSFHHGHRLSTMATVFPPWPPSLHQATVAPRRPSPTRPSLRAGRPSTIACGSRDGRVTAPVMEHPPRRHGWSHPWPAPVRRAILKPGARVRATAAADPYGRTTWGRPRSSGSVQVVAGGQVGGAGWPGCCWWSRLRRWRSAYPSATVSSWRPAWCSLASRSTCSVTPAPEEVGRQPHAAEVGCAGPEVTGRGGGARRLDQAVGKPRHRRQRSLPGERNTYW